MTTALLYKDRAFSTDSAPAINQPSAGSLAVQEGVHQLLEFAQYLSAADRALIRSIYERGMTPTALATATGQRASSIQSRVRTLRQRMISPVFRYTVRNRERWPADRRSIADAVLLQGLTQRNAAQMLNMTVYQIRREVDRIKAMCEATTRLTT